jgi:hypothetical protein
VRAAYDDLLAVAKKASRQIGKKARIEGVLVCEMVTGGVEMLVGVSHDELFGPVLTLGTGGIFTEVFGDVTFRVPPFDAAEAQRALQELTGSKLLAGLRGAKPANASRWSSPATCASSISIRWSCARVVRSPSMHWWYVRDSASPQPRSRRRQRRGRAPRQARERRAVADDQPRRQGQRGPLLRA